ncbi:MAG: type I restriction enzyme HsdR N-terminal domain-containing protein [Desulfurivibrionaceae bacterium]|nr:type I restriction enzyme HsdR N-terminal domain-containing protein [Desulfurivibrionaceae bacterium]
MADIKSHHMIHGALTDFVTGKKIVDTDDERYRQKLSRFLVEAKGYSKTDLEVGGKIETMFSGRFVVSRIDIVVAIEARRLMLIRYGPGSLVTRERPALAAARLFAPGYIIPVTVVTNGEEAEILETRTGKVSGLGLDGIPDRSRLLALAEAPLVPGPEGDRRERELRILNAFDLEVCCAGAPCVLPNAPEG